jgi:hypothetical protein
MKRLLTIALAVLFVTSISSVVLAERTALSIDGRIELLSQYQENIDLGNSLGTASMDNRVEQKINLNVDADMTDNVTGHIGLEATGAWAGADSQLTGYDIDGQAKVTTVGNGLLIDEAYIKVDELIMEELSIVAGVMNVEYSLRDDGNAMFLSLPELGAFKATLDYDPLYVDILIGKLDETRAANLNNGVDGPDDTDLYAIAVEYYLENESKIQVILFSITDKAADINLSEYSAGVSYNVSDDLEVFVQIGGQGGEWGNNNDTKKMAFNLGGEYTFSNVNLTPYVGLSYQSFGGDDTDENWVNLGDVDETIVLEADLDLRDHNLGIGKVLTTNYSVFRLVGGCQIDEKTALDAQVAMFSKTEEDMSTGFTGAGAIGQMAAGNINAAADKSIGTEIDVEVTHQLTDDLEVGLGVGYVSAGDGIEDMGDNKALTVIAASAVLTF